MDPARQFKFACPVCGQHLQARADEAGRTTDCPSCFKKLVVPQAPTEGGGKLLITASLADTRRVPAPPGSETGSRPAHELRSKASRRSLIYLLAGLIALGAAGMAFLGLKNRWVESQRDRSADVPPLWTDQLSGLELLETPVVGQLRGLDFEVNRVYWKGTTLILKQDEAGSESLSLGITFPLHGGELVPGKAFKVRTEDGLADISVQIRAKQTDLGPRESVTQGFLLWIQFDDVSTSTVGGRLHLCLLDPDKSWVAGRFWADNETHLK